MYLCACVCDSLLFSNAAYPSNFKSSYLIHFYISFWLLRRDIFPNAVKPNIFFGAGKETCFQSTPYQLLKNRRRAKHILVISVVVDISQLRQTTNENENVSINVVESQKQQQRITRGHNKLVWCYYCFGTLFIGELFVLVVALVYSFFVWNIVVISLVKYYNPNT